MKRPVAIALLIMVFASSFTATVFPVSISEAVPNPDHMFVGTSNDLSGISLDPAHGTIELTLNVYETLVAFDKEKTESYVGKLASSWSISADGKEYTFVIRQNVRFHNNKTLTTEDVEYTFKRILVTDFQNYAGFFFYDAIFGLTGSRDAQGNIVVTSQQLDSAVTRTSTTVTFHLSRIYPPFLQLLSLPCSSIICKDWCIALGDWPGTWNNWTEYNRTFDMIDQQDMSPPGPHLNAACGTGPFMFDCFQPGGE